MCCQITPAIGQEPMKPITRSRFRFMRGRSETMGGSDGGIEFLNDDGRITSYDDIGRDALRHNRTSRYHGVFTNGYALQNRRIHSNPDIIRNNDGLGPDLRAL